MIYGPEGVGKTSFGAQYPAPVFLQTAGETGLESLIDANQLPEVPHFPACHDWLALRGAVKTLVSEEHGYQTLVLDTMNGAERLCHIWLCAERFNNDWGPHGFANFQKGPQAAAAEIELLLSDLDALRRERKMRVVLLGHSEVKPFNNPEGDDYDRYRPDLSKYTWGPISQWADAVFFLNFFTVVKDEKGRGGEQRVLYTERRAAFDAKNRLGLPPQIHLGATPQTAWQAFYEAMVAGRNNGKAVA